MRGYVSNHAWRAMIYCGATNRRVRGREHRHRPGDYSPAMIAGNALLGAIGITWALNTNGQTR